MKITHVQVLSPYRLKLTFNDGSAGSVDLGDLAGKGVFASWPTDFAEVSIGSGGELIWPGGADLCADMLYLRATGKTVESLFSAPAKATCCA